MGEVSFSSYLYSTFLASFEFNYASEENRGLCGHYSIYSLLSLEVGLTNMPLRFTSI